MVEYCFRVIEANPEGRSQKIEQIGEMKDKEKPGYNFS